MESDNEHRHLTTADLRRAAAIDDFEQTDEELRLLMTVQMKKETCDICAARAQLFYAATDMLGEGFTRASEAETSQVLISQAIRALRDSVETMDTQLQARMTSWLEGAHGLLHSLDSLTLRPALAGAVRSTNTQQEAESEHMVTTIEAVPDEDGFFEFCVREQMQASFRIDATTPDGVPICVLILTHDGELSQLLPFQDLLGRKTTGQIALEPGDYLACVLIDSDESDG